MVLNIVRQHSEHPYLSLTSFLCIGGFSSLSPPSITTCNTISWFNLSSLSPFQFLHRLRPRIPHIYSAWSSGNNQVGRVASFSSGLPVWRWWLSADLGSAAEQREKGQEQAGTTGEREESDTGNEGATFTGTKGRQSALHAPSEKDLEKVSNFYRQQPVCDRRIHILGVGSLGRFIAHSLRSLPNPPPVTLLLHDWQMMEKWKASSQAVRLITSGDLDTQVGYDVEMISPRRRFHGKEITFEEGTTAPGMEGESTEPITSLIVCAPAPKVLQGLSAVSHRLDKDSAVLFLQNGMGTIEEVNREIFPDPETRPRYMRGISTHRTNTHPDDPFTAVYTGPGTMSLGILPHEREGGALPYKPPQKFAPGSKEPIFDPHWPSDPDIPLPQNRSFKWSPYDRYLLRTLLRAPVLCSTALSPSDLLQMQLERLAVNSIIGPLTVMLDARNGSILYNYNITRTIRLLLSEISLVIRSLPQLQYIPNVAQRFDPGRLETFTVGVAHRTREDISPMLDSVRSGRQTDVDYHNGWIVQKGEELGVRCFMNYMMLNLVKGKGRMIQAEMGEDVPLLPEKPREGEIVIKGEGGPGSIPVHDD